MKPSLGVLTPEKSTASFTRKAWKTVAIAEATGRLATVVHSMHG